MPTSVASPDPGRSTRVRPTAALDLRVTLAPYRYGFGDPSFQYADGRIWRTFGTPVGPATAALRIVAGEIEAVAWGEGAPWVLDHLPQIAGLRDDPSGFDPKHPLLRDLHRRYAGMRIAGTPILLDSLLPAILSQKITGKEAFTAWRGLLRQHGVAAPGPAPRGMRVPPTAAAVAGLGDWHWHQLGVDHAHRQTIRRVVARASALQRLVDLPAAQAETALRSIRGIGVWTAAEVLERVHGSADHPSFGDYHIPGIVCLALSGESGDDERMAELLEEYRPHRGRVVRLLELSGVRPERRGPRRTIPDFRGS